MPKQWLFLGVFATRYLLWVLDTRNTAIDVFLMSSCAESDARKVRTSWKIEMLQSVLFKQRQARDAQRKPLVTQLLWANESRIVLAETLLNRVDESLNARQLTIAACMSQQIEFVEPQLLTDAIDMRENANSQRLLLASAFARLSNECDSFIGTTL